MELRYGHVISFTRRLGDLLVRSGPKSTICFEHGRWPRVVLIAQFLIGSLTMLLYVVSRRFPLKTFVVMCNPSDTIAKVRANLLHMLYELDKLTHFQLR